MDFSKYRNTLLPNIDLIAARINLFKNQAWGTRWMRVWAEVDDVTPWQQCTLR